MKNLKQILFKSFVLSAVLLFMSCSNDDDKNDNAAPSVIGTWLYVGYVENDDFYSDLDECEKQLITLNDDNTALIEIEDCDFGDQSVEFVWEKIGDDKYSFDLLGDSANVFLTFPTDEDTMHLTVEEDPDYSEVYQRQ